MCVGVLLDQYRYIAIHQGYMNLRGPFSYYGANENYGFSHLCSRVLRCTTPPTHSPEYVVRGSSLECAHVERDIVVRAQSAATVVFAWVVQCQEKNGCVASSRVHVLNIV